MSRTYHHGKKNKKKLFGDQWYWLRSEPKWWRKLFKHTPQRAQKRKCIQQISAGQQEVDWPLDKKPHHYYW